jgi:uncharacterized membrane protein YGL010W
MSEAFLLNRLTGGRMGLELEKLPGANRSLSYWLDRYALTHRNRYNIRIHFICVPLIFFTVIALLDAVRIFALTPTITFTAAWILIFAALVFYARISLKTALLMGSIAIVFLMASESLYGIFGSDFFVTSGVMFALAWVGQFVGHKIEGAKPAFFEDLLFLFVGPVWIAVEIAGGASFKHNGVK